jgi:hypothetical protein
LVLLKDGPQPITEYAFGIVAGIGYAVLMPPRKHAYLDSVMAAGSFWFPLWGIANIVLFSAFSGQFMEAGFASMQKQLPGLFLWILFGVFFGLLAQLGGDVVDSIWGKETLENTASPVTSRHILIPGGGFAGMKTAEDLESVARGELIISRKSEAILKAH